MDGVGYARADRGNQTYNGIFAYMYDGADRMVGVQAAAYA